MISGLILTTTRIVATRMEPRTTPKTRALEMIGEGFTPATFREMEWSGAEPRLGSPQAQRVAGQVGSTTCWADPFQGTGPGPLGVCNPVDPRANSASVVGSRPRSQRSVFGLPVRPHLA